LENRFGAPHEFFSYHKQGLTDDNMALITAALIESPQVIEYNFQSLKHDLAC
jgi:hypothetical protein